MWVRLVNAWCRLTYREQYWHDGMRLNRGLTAMLNRHEPLDPTA